MGKQVGTRTQNGKAKKARRVHENNRKKKIYVEMQRRNDTVFA